MKLKKLLLSLLFSLAVVGCTTTASSSSSATSSSTSSSLSSSSAESSSSTSTGELKGEALKLKLREENVKAHKYKTTYKEIRYMFKDSDKGASGKMRLFFTHEEIDGTWDGGSSYNREHVWPQSQGWFKEDGAGSDLHHIRPTRVSTNSDHGNKPYGEVSHYSSVSLSKGNGILGGYYTSQYYEPVDHAKGDVARIIFYLLVRYEESDKYAITKIAQSYEMLLRWNALDPVDEWEMHRNNYVAKEQGNRNPFIDNPEYAELIWG